MTFYRRSPAELAGGDFDVIRLEGTNNIIHRQLVIDQPVGVQPDTHGILGPEHFHLAYARHPGQDLLQIGLGIVPQVDAVHAAVFRYEADHHQVISGGLADRDTPHAGRLRGRLAMASWSLFCTLAQARSGSVPGAKVNSMRELPAESLVAER